MKTALAVQLISSFLVGGGMIAFLSILAEKTSERVSGIIMMFPTTIVLGFFFLGLTTSADKVASIVPATLTPLGIVIFSSVIYISMAQWYRRFISPVTGQIVATLVTSSMLWFLLAAPFAVWKLTNLPLGITGYFVLAGLAHYILNRERNIPPITRRSYTGKQILFRALFIGSIIMVVVLMDKTLDPFWGGVFTMYPAATFATLSVFHFYYEPAQLFQLMKRAPIGSLSLLVYALAVMMLFPAMGILWGSCVAYAVSLTCSLLLIRCSPGF